MEAFGSPLLRRSPNMKNFARLVRFAWPYRVRFGLSLGCAMLVALLYGADIAAVYPLLKILFYNENCQNWVAKEIVLQETEVRTIDARLAELDFTSRLGRPAGQALKDHFTAVHTRCDDLRPGVPPAGDARSRTPRLLGHRGKAEVRDQAQLDAFRRELQVAEARLDELKRYSDAQVERPRRAPRRRPPPPARQASGPRPTLWLAAVPLAPAPDQPLPAAQGLPDPAAPAAALVMAGVALKGLFLFLQEVLVADVMQLTLFDIRNHFYRRTMALDLSSFGDQGSAELISRFTNDMDSVGQGLNTLLSKVIREPLRIVSCLAIALWLNWRLTCLALVLVPVSAPDGQPRRARS